jgi:hypothetical protein
VVEPQQPAARPGAPLRLLREAARAGSHAASRLLWRGARPMIAAVPGAPHCMALPDHDLLPPLCTVKWISLPHGRPTQASTLGRPP